MYVVKREDSALFESYLEANDLWAIKVADRKSKEQCTLVSNILFVTRPIWLGLIVAGTLSSFASLLSGWSWGITGLVFGIGAACGILFLVSRTGIEKAESPEEHRARDEYTRLLYHFHKEIEMTEDVVHSLPLEDLKEAATKKLRSIAAEITELQKQKKSAYDEKNYFRFAHQMMFKLGLVAPQYDRYFAD